MPTIPPAGVPFHRVAIRDLGIYLLEYLNLEELATDQAYEFFFMVAPLKLTAGVGSPINPIAIL
jgi:kynurenine formamidase